MSESWLQHIIARWWRWPRKPFDLTYMAHNDYVLSQFNHWGVCILRINRLMAKGRWKWKTRFVLEEVSNELTSSHFTALMVSARGRKCDQMASLFTQICFATSWCQCQTLPADRIAILVIWILLSTATALLTQHLSVECCWDLMDLPFSCLLGRSVSDQYDREIWSWCEFHLKF